MSHTAHCITLDRNTCRVRIFAKYASASALLAACVHSSNERSPACFVNLEGAERSIVDHQGREEKSCNVSTAVNVCGEHSNSPCPLCGLCQCQYFSAGCLSVLVTPKVLLQQRNQLSPA